MTIRNLKFLLKNLQPWLACLVFLMLSMGLASGAAADDGAAEAQLRELINQARANPLAMAEMVGADAETILTCNSGRKPILTNGLRPLSSNQKLVQTASEHTQEMLENDSYRKISVDGRRPVERIAESGYRPLITGERIGIIGFNNLLPEEQAVWELFKNMFLDEIQCGSGKAWHILNPEFSEIGVSVKAGIMNAEDNPINIYVATCDFAASGKGPLAAERRLLQWINMVRANPKTALSYLDLDHKTAAEALAANKWILLFGLPPIAANEDLFGFAKRYANGELTEKAPEAVNRSETSLTDIRSLLYEEIGYDAALAEERMIRYDFGDEIPSPEEGVFRIFIDMLEAELAGSGEQSLAIFNPRYTEMGIYYRQAQEEGEPGKESACAILELVLAEPCETRSHLVGQVSWTTTKTAEEESNAQKKAANGLLVELSRPSALDAPDRVISTAVFTDPVGGFSLRAPAGEGDTGDCRLTVCEILGEGGSQILCEELIPCFGKRNILKNIQVERNAD